MRSRKTAQPDNVGSAWPDGVLQRLPVGTLQLESGAELPGVVLGYETWGTLNEDASNAVLVLHALTGSAHVSRGSSNEDGWWEPLVGPGRAIDTDEMFVVAPNIIGGCYGTTGPSSPAPDGAPWGSRFPHVTVRDSVSAEVHLADALGIGAWHTVVGGSMGGARALEWAAMHPDRVSRCICVAGCAASTAEQIAFAQAQILAIRQDPNFAGGDYYDGVAPAAGLGLARRIAHITYRSEPDLGARFGRLPQDTEEPLPQGDGGRGRYQVESYLDYQAGKLAGRFDANSYIVVTEALTSHDLTRGRGSIADIFAGTGIEFVIAAVSSDRLYFPAESERLVTELPPDVPVRLEMIDSPFGHDAFLIEAAQLSDIVRC
ncbi:homoserine O-acetyltransferase MetX [Arthrobacter castelli]|uniref:homoserine O-acetyltransferase MetX n=1 Tax=Arthrobacter castelli TaxID=271431 RepID=UPI00056140AC|nr:homoserine O-acetyltransferase [Arthrobacter castelli]